MNILIVGNGFDLSHYLPTKYDHFMAAMGAVERWDESKGNMGFDYLFQELIDIDDFFIKQTKLIYGKDSLKINIEDISFLQKRLSKNVWYQYFKNHVHEVKTWIDFESKIQECLSIVGDFFRYCADFQEKYGKLDIDLTLSKLQRKEIFYLNSKKIEILEIIQAIFNNEFFPKELKVAKYEKYISYLSFNQKIINFLFFRGENEKNGFDFHKYIGFLNEHLESFIEIFNEYLMLIMTLEWKENLKINFPFDQIDKVYSFNYTNTLEKYYQFKNVDYLHGKIGKKQNLVLGISEIERDNLKNIKAYGFTKYHQKLLKKTDYQFLHDLKIELNQLREDINTLRESMMNDNWKSPEMKQGDRERFYELRKELKSLKGEIYIWGHSLDTSDKNYINEIFEFNQVEKDFEVIVYYFDAQANFDLLANLIHILGKEKVEKWMKKGWLKFEPNPDIAKLNNIEPVELPKLAEA